MALVPDLLGQRQSCSQQPGTPPGSFALTIEPGDFYYAPPVYPAGTYAAASDGTWLLLEPLPVGRHLLRFGGRFEIPGFGTFEQDNTYEIDVKPVPAPLPLAGVAGALMFARRLRRRLPPGSAPRN